MKTKRRRSPIVLLLVSLFISLLLTIILPWHSTAHSRELQTNAYRRITANPLLDITHKKGAHENGLQAPSSATAGARRVSLIAQTAVLPRRERRRSGRRPFRFMDQVKISTDFRSATSLIVK